MPHALAVEPDHDLRSRIAPPPPLARARVEGRLGPLLGASPPMHDLYARLCRVAPTDATVLLTGESGTGKGLAAKTLHLLGARAQGPFLSLHCGAVPPALIADELFGGGGGGGGGRLRGCLERARGGTLVLDGIAELPAEVQVRLLQVLETGELVPTGGDPPVAIDVRVIASTHRDPGQAVAAGRLREDLRYRLSVFPISLPPLRERGDDVQLLAGCFLGSHCDRTGAGRAFTPEAMDRLRSHPWPGNVRELKSAVHRAFLHGDGGEIGPECLPEEIGGRPAAGRPLCFRVGASIAEVERALIQATLECHDGNKRKTAEVLGVSLKTLYNRLNAYKQEGNGG
jgi:DNA-binding NtrC family response regulator